MNLPQWDGWHLIGAYPDHEPGDVGSWILENEGEALLLEAPEGLSATEAVAVWQHLGCPRLRFVTASHAHADHLDTDAWVQLQRAFPAAMFLHPRKVHGRKLLHLGDEPLWLLKAPKHSPCDVVTVFRGVAMTGDIELGMLESVNDEVPPATKRKSMAALRYFCADTNYHIHSIISAHLNDVRRGIDWPSLFTID